LDKTSCGGCNNCGYNKNPYSLDFHHIDKNNKSFTISSSYLSGTKSFDDVLNEINKCEVLCQIVIDK